MKKNCIFHFLLILILHTQPSAGQNTRIHTRETIGWYNLFANFKLDEKLGIHAEYQFRRADLLSEAQQSLLRIGINYQASPQTLLRLGYAWIETFPYGEIPLNAMGRDFTEHRLYEMLQLSHREGKVDISHRFMLEQRFIGRYSSAMPDREDEFPLTHRARYMIRLQFPLKGREVGNNTPYMACFDEIMIGFGKNVNENIFDQNRYGVLLGYRFNGRIRLETGYLNQSLQFAREINGRNVFQHNNGLILNLYFSFAAKTKN